MNENRQDGQTVAATLKQQVRDPRNMQLARRTAVQVACQFRESVLYWTFNLDHISTR
jgi:hypothetical protein